MNQVPIGYDSRLIVSEVCKWFKSIRVQNRSEISEVSFDVLKDWVIDQDSGNLKHRTGQFFSVVGLIVNTNYDGAFEWGQPIIWQPEVGILGIITRVVDRERWYLMQAKMEPGNINEIQLSPTVQATRSNYMRAHGGGKTNYATYFLDKCEARVISDQTWSEQGGRFYAKKNRNVVIEIQDDIDTTGYYRWMSSKDLRALISVDNVVNMDTRSVLSTMINKYRAVDYPLHNLSTTRKWCDQFVRENKMDSKIVPLKSLPLWKKGNYEIKQTITDYFFSINAVKIVTESREVRRWDQPMIKDTRMGLIGFLVSFINDTLHFSCAGQVGGGIDCPYQFRPNRSMFRV